MAKVKAAVHAWLTTEALVLLLVCALVRRWRFDSLYPPRGPVRYGAAAGTGSVAAF